MVKAGDTDVTLKMRPMMLINRVALYRKHGKQVRVEGGTVRVTKRVLGSDFVRCVAALLETVGAEMAVVA